MKWMRKHGRSRANVPQTSLAIDNGATVQFFSNWELLKLIKLFKKMKIRCGGSSFIQCKAGLIHTEMRHLPIQRKKICITKDGIANLLSMG